MPFCKLSLGLKILLAYMLLYVYSRNENFLWISGYKIEFSGSIYEKMLVSDRPFILFYVFQQHFRYEIEYIITSKVRTSYKTSHFFFQDLTLFIWWCCKLWQFFFLPISKVHVGLPSQRTCWVILTRIMIINSACTYV